MAKLKLRLEDIAADRSPDPVVTPAPAPAPAAPPAKPKAPKREHTSIYLSRPVRRVLRRIAADLTDEDDIRTHDLLIEGVELVLRKYGKPSIAEIEAAAAKR